MRGSAESASRGVPANTFLYCGGTQRHWVSNIPLPADFGVSAPGSCRQNDRHPVPSIRGDALRSSTSHRGQLSPAQKAEAAKHFKSALGKRSAAAILGDLRDDPNAPTVTYTDDEWT
ncbi:hypothetical protein ARSEF4850_009853, partial [Beauveria asiatica]